MKSFLRGPVGGGGYYLFETMQNMPCMRTAGEFPNAGGGQTSGWQWEGKRRRSVREGTGEGWCGAPTSRQSTEGPPNPLGFLYLL